MEDSFNPYSFVHVWFNPTVNQKHSCAGTVQTTCCSWCLTSIAVLTCALLIQVLMIMGWLCTIYLCWLFHLCLRSLHGNKTHSTGSTGEVRTFLWPHAAALLPPTSQGLRESLQAGLSDRGFSDLHRKNLVEKGMPRHTRQFHTIPDKKGGAGWFQGAPHFLHIWIPFFSAARCSFRFSRHVRGISGLLLAGFSLEVATLSININIAKQFTKSNKTSKH